MTTTLFLLACLLVAVIFLAIVLWRSSREMKDSPVDLAVLSRNPRNQTAYEPLARLFSDEDTAFLRGQKGYSRGMARRLSRQRRQVFVLYLRQIRREFGDVWRICRLLAPMSSDPEFGALVTKQFFVFHGLYWLLRAGCVAGVLMPVRINPLDLVSSLQHLRQGARQAFQSLEPAAQSAAFGA